MHDTKIISSEISEGIQKGKGCIVFDFGCYFPYGNDLIFDFSLGGEKLTDKKLNHRYPNKAYHTISRKYGKRVSRIGYPYFFDFKETNPNTWLLNLTVGMDSEENAVRLVFPLILNVTTEKPVCALSLKYNFIEQRFTFRTHKPSDDGIGWKTCCWTNDDKFGSKETDVIKFETPEIIQNGSIVIYQNAITPVFCEMKRLLIL